MVVKIRKRSKAEWKVTRHPGQMVGVCCGLSVEDLIGYAPIKGMPEFLDDIIDVTLGEYKPDAYIKSIATAGDQEPCTMPYGIIRRSAILF